MAGQARQIRNGDIVRAAKDIYLGETMIPAGTKFVVCSRELFPNIFLGDKNNPPAEPRVISGFGITLTIGIDVVFFDQLGANRYPGFIVPLDHLKL